MNSCLDDIFAALQDLMYTFGIIWGGGNNNTRNVKQRGNSGVWRRTNPFLHTKTIQFDAMWINMQEIENTANIYLLTN